ncbi:hypothetical protein LPB67_09790 [Undibacterium sp. Jales W-56]|uniref:hypothetical protein n=1 Tax=Undibacterium sp. Jales W-56 TaxID=2897325 RepID=UPI0021D06F0B|nr:hypothetical protein [Undibacterium sp. Jales W-56]MCU6434057.1 hypothetical protein [Undibacterium sp. Jales W-56]
MKEYAAAALARQFPTREQFDAFYSLLTDEQKDELLRVGSYYLFLVKQGDWHVDVDNSNPVVDYITNSFKLVSLFSLIESMSGERHQDFYDWLQCHPDKVFPIPDRAALEVLHEQYKSTFGSIRRCVAFFERLAPSRQAELLKVVTFNQQPAKSIKHVAQFLYNLRSKFVHEGEFVLDLASLPVMSQHKNAITMTSLSMDTLLEIFEEGVVAQFRHPT